MKRKSKYLTADYWKGIAIVILAWFVIGLLCLPGLIEIAGRVTFWINYLKSVW